MDSQDVLYIVRCYGVVKRSFTAPGHQLAYGSLKVADGELDKVACKFTAQVKTAQLVTTSHKIKMN